MAMTVRRQPSCLVRVMAVLGTRPEAIKLGPIVRELTRARNFDVTVVATGQHADLVGQMLRVFRAKADYDLGVMTDSQTLSGLTERILNRLDPVLQAEKPDVVLVQGDTTTAFAAALGAFYRRIPVGHVEAGLRTDDRYSPFPEEINRRLVSQLSTWHFAPTESGRSALLRDGVENTSVFVTGNPVIDALHYVLTSCPWPAVLAPPAGRLILVTGHRRESFGAPLERVCRALRRVADEYEDVDVWYPVHPNPQAAEPARRLLARHPRIKLLDPLDYVTFCHVMARAHVVVTDSGGVQEEAPSLGKPVLVTREVTERPEGIAAGAAELVGTDEKLIVSRLRRLLDDMVAYEAMSRAVNPYGDGFAARRIVRCLRNCLGDTLRDTEPIETELSA